jgi:hypothetical protein
MSGAAPDLDEASLRRVLRRVLAAIAEEAAGEAAKAGAIRRAAWGVPLAPGLLRRCAPRNDTEGYPHTPSLRAEGEAIQGTAPGVPLAPGLPRLSPGQASSLRSSQ